MSGSEQFEKGPRPLTPEELESNTQDILRLQLVSPEFDRDGFVYLRSHFHKPRFFWSKILLGIQRLNSDIKISQSGAVVLLVPSSKGFQKRGYIATARNLRRTRQPNVLAATVDESGLLIGQAASQSGSHQIKVDTDMAPPGTKLGVVVFDNRGLNVRERHFEADRTARFDAVAFDENYQLIPRQIITV